MPFTLEIKVNVLSESTRKFSYPDRKTGKAIDVEAKTFPALSEDGREVIVLQAPWGSKAVLKVGPQKIRLLKLEDDNGISRGTFEDQIVSK